MNKEDLLKKYPKTDTFEIVGSTGVPHPYVIGPRHIAYASKHHGGMLGKDAIRNMERAEGHGCCMFKNCQLTHDEHEVALIVGVRSELPLEQVPGLQEYLQSCAPLAEQDNVKGFTFKKLPKEG